MCSIAGMFDFRTNRNFDEETVRRVGNTMRRRGPDGEGIYSFPGGALHHHRLAVMDPKGGGQPMSAVWDNKRYTIVYNGEIYNGDDLKAAFRIAGATFVTKCDTEVVLWSYILYGEKSPSLLSGIFAYAILSEDLKSGEKEVFFARDRFGIKPFYYLEREDFFAFASEVKGLLALPGEKARIEREGLWQLLYLSPVTLPGTTVFKGIRALLPGYAARYHREGFSTFPYWKLKAKPFTGSREEAIEMTGALLRNAVRSQLESDVPLSVFLSGGLDSSVVAALSAEYMKERGKELSTYSFEYEGNREHFRSSLFQPAGDDEYAVSLAVALGTDHTVLRAPNRDVARLLYDAALARDLPGQADIDSSLLYFCSEVKRRHTVALSGECADEIFGGYPWFYRPEMLSRDFFPWLHEPRARISLFRKEAVLPDEGYRYLSEIYEKDRKETAVLEEDSEAMRASRFATRLSTRYFMANLLERKDRMSMYSGLEVRVPFGDHRILEYVYNVPWEYKMENGHEKSLLREAMRGYLPDEILWRKKSPYPKTHHPEYEETVAGMLKERLGREGALSQLVDRERIRALTEGENVTWFGQLMSRPQLLAWLYQFDVFCEAYGVDFDLG